MTGPRRQLVIDLATEGVRPADIAVRLGITTNTVSNHLSQARAAGHHVEKFKPGPDPKKRADRYTIYLSVTAQSQLSKDAALRGTQPALLLRRFVHVVLTEGMVNAILDDCGGRS